MRGQLTTAPEPHSRPECADAALVMFLQADAQPTAPTDLRSCASRSARSDSGFRPCGEEPGSDLGEATRPDLRLQRSSGRLRSADANGWRPDSVLVPGRASGPGLRGAERTGSPSNAPAYGRETCLGLGQRNEVDRTRPPCVRQLGRRDCRGTCPRASPCDRGAPFHSCIRCGTSWTYTKLGIDRGIPDACAYPPPLFRRCRPSGVRAPAVRVVGERAGDRDGGDSHNEPVSSACGASMPRTEVEAAATKLAVSAPATALPNSLIAAGSLSASLSRGSLPTRTITFKVFGPQPAPSADCSAGGTTVGTATLAGNARAPAPPPGRARTAGGLHAGGRHDAKQAVHRPPPGAVIATAAPNHRASARRSRQPSRRRPRADLRPLR